MLIWRWTVGLALALSLAACGEAPGSAAHTQLQAPRMHMISRDLSRVIGERGYAELIEVVNSEQRLVTQERAKKRVEAITARLVRQAVAAYPFSKDWSWELQILKDDAINATCMPGGKMTLNTGLIALTQWDEHKLATVLGHEIAHALLEHGRVSIGRGAVTLGTLRVVAESFKMGQVRLNALAEGLGTVTLPLEREHEREADLLGMQLMARAGFDPVKGAAIWVDMGGDEAVPLLAQRLESYRGSHPTSAERLARLTDIAAQLAARAKP